MEQTRLIILDRDGVINYDSPRSIRTPEEWEAIPGSVEAIARLCREDYRVVVITNQSGISRGYYTINTLNRIHQKMLEEVHKAGGEISAIFFCPHSDTEKCDCRKPKPGMFLELKDRLKCNLEGVYAVGDSVRDLQAAAAVGATPILVRSGKGKSSEKELESGDFPEELRNVPCYGNLGEFVDELLSVPASS